MLKVDKKYVKELTIDEFKQLINETIAENIQMWFETFEIMSNKEMMEQIISAEKALSKKQMDEFLDWEEVKEDV